MNMKRILAVFMASMLLLTGSITAYASEISISDLENNNILENRIKNHQSNKELKNQKIKVNNKVDILSENCGNLAYTYADDVDTPEEIELFVREMSGINAQSTTSLYDSNVKVDSQGEGDFEQSFDDSVEYYFSLLDDDTVYLDGEGFSYYYRYPSSPTTAMIDYITSVEDNFLIEYDQIDNISTGVSVSGGTTGGEGTGSTSWSRSYTYSEYSINWPDLQDKVWYGRSYGTVFVKTDNLTEITHNSSAIAVLRNGRSIWCNAFDYAYI